MARRRYKPGIVDRYTLAHVAVGVVYGLLKLEWWTATALAVGWEVVEPTLKDELPQVFPDPRHDPLGNTIMDGTAVLAGYAITRGLTTKP